MTVQEYFEEAFSRERPVAAADMVRANYILDQIPEGVSTILEVGCGDGIVSKILKDHYDLVGLELTEAGVDRTRSMGISCQQGDIADIPRPDGSYDLILASEVLEHLGGPLLEKGLAEMARVTRKYVLVTVPNRERLKASRRECPYCKAVNVPWTHIRSFSRKDLEELMTPWGFLPRTVKAFGPRQANRDYLLARIIHWHNCFIRRLPPGEICSICMRKAPGIRCKGLPSIRAILRQPRYELLRVLDNIVSCLPPKYPRWLLALYSPAPEAPELRAAHTEQGKRDLT